jgi:beta-lactamase class A
VIARMEQLERRLREIGADHSGKWTCAVTDVATGEHIGIDEDDVMPTASLIKVPVLYALYQAVAEGRFALADEVTYGQHHRSLGSGVLSQLSPGVRMTVRDAAMLMIIVSDNSATNMCIDLVGLERVNESMRRLGLTDTKLLLRLGDPGIGLEGRNMAVSTAREMTRLMALLACHQAVSPEASQDMLRILRRCQSRVELSGEMPWNELNMLDDHQNNWVAEKGGAFLNGVRCGGAVFHSPKGEFAMAAFTEGGLRFGAGHDAEGNRLLGALGKAAWDVLAA